MEVLSLPGLGNKRSGTASGSDHALKNIRRAIDQKSADALLFLCKAKDVDSRIDDRSGQIR